MKKTKEEWLKWHVHAIAEINDPICTFIAMRCDEERLTLSLLNSLEMLTEQCKEELRNIIEDKKVITQETEKLYRKYKIKTVKNKNKKDVKNG